MLPVLVVAACDKPVYLDLCSLVHIIWIFVLVLHQRLVLQCQTERSTVKCRNSLVCIVEATFPQVHYDEVCL